MKLHALLIGSLAVSTSLYSITPVEHTLGCGSGFGELVASHRTRLRTLPEEITIEVGDHQFVTKKVLGKKSSTVLLDTAEKQVLKIYNSGDEGQANFEYWASVFLKERGIAVAEVSAKPSRLTVTDAKTLQILRDAGIEPENAIVVRKKYTAGLTYRELQALTAKPDGLSRNKLNTIAEAMETKIIEVTNLFTSGEFKTWLKEKGHTPKEVGISDDLAGKGDMDVSNLVYTPGGWVVIDP